jgi:transcriptional regulator with PAS, ATPase and Fis domain
MAYTARTGLGTEKSRPSSDVELVMQTYEKMVAELRVKGQTLQGLYDDAKERAEKSEFINELIVDNIDKGIITIDPKGGVIAGNRTAFDLTGCQNLDQLRAWLKARGLLSLGSHDLPLELESDTQRYGKLHLQIEAAFFNHSGAGGQGKILVLSDVTYVRKMEEQAHLAEQSTLLGQASQKLLEKIGPELSRIRQDIRDCGLQTSIEAQVAEIEQAVQDLGKYITYQPAGDNTDKGPAIVYTSLAMSKVMDMLTKVAPTDSTVLITGESGTGKELVARKIHQLSSRGKGPFVSVNCGALPESLLESELFGYLKGAFTGAAKDKPGLLKAAEDGSFFLDEVSELSPALQVKLLRVLQEREAIPVGGTRPFKVDARILAASNQNLERMVKEGRFRQDLFFRLNVFPLEIPPLRKRPEDIPLLVEHFLKKYSAKSKTSDKHLTKAAMDIVTEYQWPGNIRELENAIERANVIAPGSTIRPEHFGLAVEAGNGQVKWGDAPGLLEVSARAAAQAEARLIKQALEEFAWNKSRAARALKISYRVMLKKIKDYELE